MSHITAEELRMYYVISLGGIPRSFCLSSFEFCSMHLFSLFLSVSFSCNNYNHEDNSESGDVNNSSKGLGLGMVWGYPNTGIISGVRQ